MRCWPLRSLASAPPHWRHTETHRDTQSHTETHRDTQRHTETHRNTYLSLSVSPCLSLAPSPYFSTYIYIYTHIYIYIYVYATHLSLSISLSLSLFHTDLRGVMSRAQKKHRQRANSDVRSRQEFKSKTCLETHNGVWNTHENTQIKQFGSSKAFQNHRNQDREGHKGRDGL